MARQLPPTGVATTETLVPVRMLARTRALTDVLVRRFTPHRAAFVVVAPRTSPGIATAVTTKQKKAAMSALATNVVREAWAGRRTAEGMRETSGGRTPRGSLAATSAAMAPWGQSCPAPRGHSTWDRWGPGARVHVSRSERAPSCRPGLPCGRGSSSSVVVRTSYLPSSIRPILSAGSDGPGRRSGCRCRSPGLAGARAGPVRPDERRTSSHRPRSTSASGGGSSSTSRSVTVTRQWLARALTAIAAAANGSMSAAVTVDAPACHRGDGAQPGARGEVEHAPAARRPRGGRAGSDRWRARRPRRTPSTAAPRRDRRSPPGRRATASAPRPRDGGGSPRGREPRAECVWCRTKARCETFSRPVPSG